jgi:hypothetical protein
MNVAEVGLLFSGVQAVAVVVGFGFSYWQLHLLQTNLRRQNAMDLMARYSSVAFARYRANLRTKKAMQQTDDGTDGVLNFFEEVAVAARHATADKDILKDYFATSLRLWLEEDYMIAALIRAQIKDSAEFANLVGLYQEWGGNHPPTLQIKMRGSVG